MRKRLGSLLATLGIALGVVAVGGCADPIRAHRVWDVRVSAATDYVPAFIPILRGHMPILEKHDRLTGPLLSDANTPIAGTQFREDCVTRLKPDRSPLPATVQSLPGYQDCQITVDTGDRAYFAAARRSGPYDVFLAQYINNGALAYNGTITVHRQAASTIRVTLSNASYLECTTIRRTRDNGDGTITYVLVYPDGQLLSELRPDHTWDPETAPVSLITKLGLPPRPRGASSEKSLFTDRATWIKAFTDLDKAKLPASAVETRECTHSASRAVVIATNATHIRLVTESISW